ncbi:flagellar hook assembly protein FlgD [Planctomycetota bacterium]
MMSTSQIANASDIQLDYMKLLVTQLQNQNPLDPMDNNEMAAQLTQFSQLQQLEALNTNFAKVLESTEQSYADSLIGQKVSYMVDNPLTGTREKRIDTVDEVYKDNEGNRLLMVGRRTLGLTDVSNPLVGKEVSFVVDSPSGPEVKTGTIDAVQTEEGQLVYKVGGYDLTFNQIADSLIGGSLSYHIQSETGISEQRDGVIEDAYLSEGQSLLVVSQPLSVDEILSVIN